MTLGRPLLRLAPLSAALLIAGCATPDEAERRAHYRCDDGSKLTIVFDGDTARLFSNGGAPIELARQPAASGFAYGTGPRSIHGKGSALTYLVGRRAPIECTETGSTS